MRKSEWFISKVQGCTVRAELFRVRQHVRQLQFIHRTLVANECGMKAISPRDSLPARQRSTLTLASDLRKTCSGAIHRVFFPLSLTS
ncbi:hypothetical protein NPIL_300871 [Nephila pilipes]|uniref:Uncharacterized protein n=1 Tax=Nephila pilipes TaxID=299642 RepID=A0A8X6NKF0_NEPPI|nr:hypothetical protein NPIL_300871 [Nephila pilipes]